MAKRIFEFRTAFVRRINRRWFVVFGCGRDITIICQTSTRSEANLIADYWHWSQCQFVSGCENPVLIRNPSTDFIALFHQMMDEEAGEELKRLEVKQ